MGVNGYFKLYGGGGRDVNFFFLVSKKLYGSFIIFFIFYVSRKV